MVYIPELKTLYQVMDWHINDAREPGKHVGIFATLPREISMQFPPDGKTGEDSSPPHITVCYLGDFPTHLEGKLESVVKNVCRLMRPFKVRLGLPKKFENEDRQTILHSPVKGKKLHDFNKALKYALLKNQIPVSNKYPEYKPHVTIEYIDEGQRPRFKKLKPAGEWVVSEVWIWGTNEPYMIPLGK